MKVGKDTLNNTFRIEDKYLIKETIGKGTFGKVKLGINKATNQKVAIKILEKNKILSKDDSERVIRELSIITKYSHSNVIETLEIFSTRECYYIIMEYCEGGELFNHIVKKHRLNENETACFYYQLINGLEYIHSHNVVHRDLKPENLLLTKGKVLKIIDFGLSNYYVGKLLSTPCGSPCYASPEMVSGKKYNGFHIDVWSTGIILFAMLCGYLPFEDEDNNVLFKMILQCRLDYPRYLSNEAIDLLKKILVTNPEKRIKIKEIKQHPFYLRGKDLTDPEPEITQPQSPLSKENEEALKRIQPEEVKVEVMKIEQELPSTLHKEEEEREIIYAPISTEYTEPKKTKKEPIAAVIMQTEGNDRTNIKSSIKDKISQLQSSLYAKNSITKDDTKTSSMQDNKKWNRSNTLGNEKNNSILRDSQEKSKKVTSPKRINLSNNNNNNDKQPQIKISSVTPLTSFLSSNKKNSNNTKLSIEKGSYDLYNPVTADRSQRCETSSNIKGKNDYASFRNSVQFPNSKGDYKKTNTAVSPQQHLSQKTGVTQSHIGSSYITSRVGINLFQNLNNITNTSYSKSFLQNTSSLNSQPLKTEVAPYSLLPSKKPTTVSTSSKYSDYLKTSQSPAIPTKYVSSDKNSKIFSYDKKAEINHKNHNITSVNHSTNLDRLQQKLNLAKPKDKPTYLSTEFYEKTKRSQSNNKPNDFLYSRNTQVTHNTTSGNKKDYYFSSNSITLHSLGQNHNIGNTQSYLKKSSIKGGAR